MILVVFFFFQAEDGIRDSSVTGVQTCALPICRLQTKLQNVQGIQLFMQPVQNITVDDRVSRTQYQYTLEDPDQNELNDWTNRFVAKLKELPELEDVATDQQIGALPQSLAIHRPTAPRLCRA